MPNGTWVAIILVLGLALSILYAVLGGDEPLYDRDRERPSETATPGPAAER